MFGMWYPEDKHELNLLLKEFLTTGKRKREVNGLVVPHAGYSYSGDVAGKAFSLVKEVKRAIILGPSHYVYLHGVLTTNKPFWKTPLGEIKIFNRGFFAGDIDQEHSIKNQVPFLQKLKCKEILPLMVGDITTEEALKIAKKISKIKALYVFSTDLSHFLPYDEAIAKDKRTIEIIENLELESFSEIDACGVYPLLILIHLCKLKDFKPVLIEYKNSGDVTGDKSAVVGYASFYF